jgi:hypothetical protein
MKTGNCSSKAVFIDNDTVISLMPMEIWIAAQNVMSLCPVLCRLIGELDIFK